MTDYEREQVIYDYLVERVTYAATTEGDMIHSLQGTLIDGEGVCDGYARTFMYLMNSVGVPTTFVTGQAGGVGHAWNQIAIQNRFYHVDVTWGDKETEHPVHIYNYMNESDDYMARTHRWDKETTQVASTCLYNPIFILNEEPGVYQVKDHTHWEALWSRILQDDSAQYTLIFYEVAHNNWSIEALIETMMRAKASDMMYRVIEKYDALIIECTVVDESARH